MEYSDYKKLKLEEEAKQNAIEAEKLEFENKLKGFMGKQMLETLGKPLIEVLEYPRFYQKNTKPKKERLIKRIFSKKKKRNPDKN